MSDPRQHYVCYINKFIKHYDCIHGSSFIQALYNIIHATLLQFVKALCQHCKVSCTLYKMLLINVQWGK